jgi:hypothetical protein
MMHDGRNLVLNVVLADDERLLSRSKSSTVADISTMTLRGNRCRGPVSLDMIFTDRESRRPAAFQMAHAQRKSGFKLKQGP